MLNRCCLFVFSMRSEVSHLLFVCWCVCAGRGEATTGAARELAHRRLGKKITKLSSERKAKAKSK